MNVMGDSLPRLGWLGVAWKAPSGRLRDRFAIQAALRGLPRSRGLGWGARGRILWGERGRPRTRWRESMQEGIAESLPERRGPRRERRIGIR